MASGGTITALDLLTASNSVDYILTNEQMTEFGAMLITLFFGGLVPLLMLFILLYMFFIAFMVPVKILKSILL